MNEEKISKVLERIGRLSRYTTGTSYCGFWKDKEGKWNLFVGVNQKYIFRSKAALTSQLNAFFYTSNHDEQFEMNALKEQFKKERFKICEIKPMEILSSDEKEMAD